jgi:perosamine synthetase
MIPLAEPTLDGNELAYLTDCITSGWVSSRGAYVKRFEQEMAAWCGVRHSIATSSGTSALHLALVAIGVGPGDEVIVPALSYVAPANAVVYTGAQPVFVDADCGTWNLDTDQLADKITPATKAIIVVHLYGHPVDMDAVASLARVQGLWVVEDACEAHGAEYKGRRAGGLGHLSCFSFFGNKIVTTGEGGMLLTDSGELAATARRLRNQATTETYHHDTVGYSYRLTNLQAAVGVAQLERVASLITARRRMVQLYNESLQDVPGLMSYADPKWGRSASWLYTLLVTERFGRSRDALIEYLTRHDVESKPFFEPLPGLPAFRDRQAYPVAEYLAQRGICLPLSANLQPRHVEYITCLIKQAARGGGA